MNNRPEEDKLDRVTDVIVDMAKDTAAPADPYSGKSEPDWEAFAIQTRRVLRDECTELWEQVAVDSSAEDKLDRLRSRVAELERELIDIPNLIVARLEEEGNKYKPRTEEYARSCFVIAAKLARAVAGQPEVRT
jgi:hypothetical protein